MTKIKVSEATGPVLDWMVAKCEDYLDSMLNVKTGVVFGLVEQLEFSSNWSQGGPIIERERIQWCELNGQIEAWSGFDYIQWRTDWGGDHRMPGGAGFGTDRKSILTAAMRCYVASKLGDELEVPKELLT